MKKTFEAILLYLICLAIVALIVGASKKNEPKHNNLKQCQLEVLDLREGLEIVRDDFLEPCCDQRAIGFINQTLKDAGK